MAISGQWGTNPLPKRPGLYINFVERANFQVMGGARGIVGMPIFEYEGGSIEEGKFATITSKEEAVKAVGLVNAKQVLAVLSRGAAEVLVYAVPKITEEYTALRDEFEARRFSVFVYPGAVSSLEQEATKNWVKRNREEGKHFGYVVGGSSADDQDPTIGNARSQLLADEYVVNLINGGVDAEGVEIPSEEYAAYIAGEIAGTAINKSVTYSQQPLTDVNKRLTNARTIEALEAGSLVLTNDGRNVRIEQGVTTKFSETKSGKIRLMRARQTIATDLPELAKEYYIGKIDNNPAGQASLISAIKQYLETLELNNVLVNSTVALDPRYKSTGDCVFIVIDTTEVDSMERIFIEFGV